jgi:hypothetical protein
MLGYLWVATIEPVNKAIFVGIRISFERNMLIAEQFLKKGLVKKYGKHPSTLQMVEPGIHKLASF